MDPNANDSTKRQPAFGADAEAEDPGTNPGFLLSGAVRRTARQKNVSVAETDSV